MITVLLLIAGILLLLFGGDFLVKGASGIALKFDMPPMLVGMTVVAFGTSAPELVVSVQAALAGKSDIAIGNVVGSNIANVALILGLTVIIFPMTVKRDSLRIDWVAMVLASILVYLFALNYEISQIEGIIMILALIGFIVFSFLRSNRKKLTALPPDVPIDAKSQPVWMLILFVVLGCVALVFGARWFLSGAENVARSFGVSDRIIAITLVAFGTSVPELAASVIAAFKKEQDISLGNIIGSNLFNLLFILGITAAIQTIDVDAAIMSSDIFWMLGTSFAILPLAVWRLRINRLSGVVLVSSYVAFIAILLTTP